MILPVWMVIGKDRKPRRLFKFFKVQVGPTRARILRKQDE